MTTKDPSTIPDRIRVPEVLYAVAAGRVLDLAEKELSMKERPATLFSAGKLPQAQSSIIAQGPTPPKQKTKARKK